MKQLAHNDNQQAAARVAERIRQDQVWEESMRIVATPEYDAKVQEMLIERGRV